MPPRRSLSDANPWKSRVFCGKMQKGFGRSTGAYGPKKYRLEFRWGQGHPRLRPGLARQPAALAFPGAFGQQAHGVSPRPAAARPSPAQAHRGRTGGWFGLPGIVQPDAALPCPPKATAPPAARRRRPALPATRPTVGRTAPPWAPDDGRARTRSGRSAAVPSGGAG